jgi:hypothetical protein
MRGDENAYPHDKSILKRLQQTAERSRALATSLARGKVALMTQTRTCTVWTRTEKAHTLGLSHRDMTANETAQVYLACWGSSGDETFRIKTF